MNVCVLVPTFNNAGTLTPLLHELQAYQAPVIVVNDGSTDDTELILQHFSGIHYTSYTPNRGKGYALQKGFQMAIEKGYDYVISIDSDGQHFVKDITAFLAMLKENPGSLIIGARNMNQSSVPSKSSFGHRFSNFWFWVETGIRLPDTQSGYRLYPVSRLNPLYFFTRRFEFEIEVIVRAAWKGIPVIAVPVSVYYAPPEERVSHFRPFIDFTRISVLNTFLVFASIFYIRPRNLIRRLFLNNKWKEIFVDELFDTRQSNARKSVSVGFGIMMGILPIWGFQLVTAVFLAVVLRLNKGLVILFANISIPPMIPLIIYGSYRMGTIWMSDAVPSVTLTKSLSLSMIRYNFKQYLLGSISLALIAGGLAGLITIVLLRIFSKKTGAAA